MIARTSPSILAILLCAAASIEARQAEDAIARDIVIGQAYASGNIVVAGFVPDETRTWPQTITLARLSPPAAQHPSADFVRPLRDEHPVAFAGDGVPPPDQHLFAGIDNFFDDRPIALYKARVTIAESISVIGWSGTRGIRDVSYQNRDQPRPTSDRERSAIAAEKRKLPKNIKCTTEPQWLDAAKIMLTVRLTGSPTTLRLSSYQDPGCSGHLSTIYVLDVITPGRDPRRFEFRHQQGVL